MITRHPRERVYLQAAPGVPIEVYSEGEPGADPKGLSKHAVPEKLEIRELS